MGEDYAPYTTSITEASVEDGGLNGFFSMETMRSCTMMRNTQIR